MTNKFLELLSSQTILADGAMGTIEQLRESNPFSSIY